MKKSQITIFLLISLVVLVAFLLVFAFIKSVSNSQGKSQSNLLFSDSSQKETLTRYIETCISEVSQDAIYTISKQGGFFFQDQMGSMIDWDIPKIQHINQSIAYQIYSPNPNLIASDNFYPCYTARAYVPPIMKGQYCFESYNHLQPFYLFGSSGDPIKSVNPDLCEAYNYSKADYDCFCQECNGYSIESQLENYINYNLPDCLNFSNFYDFDISSGNISTDILIENKGVTINLDYPLVISNQGNKAETYSEKFSITLPIRLKTIYDLTRNIINQEINNLSFNLQTTPYKQNIPYLTFSTKTIPQNTSYIFTINDSQSNFKGNNFIFQFAIQNRQPALNYYNPDDCYVDGEYYHICVVEGQKIFLQPQGFDPDTPDLLYSYSGWKVNQDSLWTTTSSNPLPHQEIFKSNFNHWETSDIFTTTNQFATYQTNRYDLGSHIVNISIFDTFGLKDHQEIKILVDDIPETFFIAQSIYGDIPDDFISLEDPIFLNGSSTKDHIGGSNLLYQWEDHNTNKKWPYAYDQEIISFLASITLPNQFLNTNDTPFIFPPEGLTKEISLTAKTGNSVIGKYQKEISIFQCLPHRENSAPYPFHNYNNDIYPNLLDSLNPLFANHSCCSDGTDGKSYGQIKTGDSCYSFVDFGCIFHFDLNDQRYIDPAGIISSRVQSGEIENPLNYLTRNDNIYGGVYKRELNVDCGNSGKRCDGDVSVEITYIQDCPNACHYAYPKGTNHPINIGCS